MRKHLKWIGRTHTTRSFAQIEKQIRWNYIYCARPGFINVLFVVSCIRGIYLHNASRVIQHYYVGCLVRSGKSWGLQSRTHNHCFRRHHSIPQAAPKPEPRASGGSLVWDSAPYTDKGKSEGGYALSLAGLVVSLARIIRICIIPAINRAAIARTTTCANKP